MWPDLYSAWFTFVGVGEYIWLAEACYRVVLKDNCFIRYCFCYWLFFFTLEALNSMTDSFMIFFLNYEAVVSRVIASNRI